MNAPVTQQQAGCEPIATPDPKKTRVFRSARAAMSREAAARQLRLTTLAWSTLRSPERVKDFLNSDHATLPARPLEMAIASDAGLAQVERLLIELPVTEVAAA